MKKKTTFIVFLNLLLLSILINQPLLGWAKEKYERFRTLTEILNLVENNYVEEIKIDKLIVGGIKGILRELDPHSTFLAKKDYKKFKDDSNGKFGGLGIQITVREKVIVVIAPIEDSPAWKSGVKAGDKIIRINNESIEDYDLSQVSEKLRGKTGTKVTLTVLRKGLEKPKNIVVKRGIVTLKSVKHRELRDGYVYIRITSFREKTHKDLVKALKKYTRRNKKIKGLILDLRNNPGGFLDQAILVSDTFLDSGDIVSTKKRGSTQKQVIKAKKHGTYKGFPIVVLTNAYSASASEIVAGALKDNKRALIVGEKSFGKGSVQSLIKLHDGSALKLTVARYYTPKGISIQAEGIRPDIEIKQIDLGKLKTHTSDEVFREKDIRGHLKKTKENLPQELQGISKENRQFLEKDFQLLEAYRYVRAFKKFQSLNR